MQAETEVGTERERNWNNSKNLVNTTDGSSSSPGNVGHKEIRIPPASQ